MGLEIPELLLLLLLLPPAVSGKNFWETDFYTPPVLGGAALLPFSAPAVQKKIRVLRAQDFYTPVALKTAKGQHLPALEVYKNQSPGNGKEHKTKLLGLDFFQWGGGLPREWVGTKSSVCLSKPKESKLFPWTGKSCFSNRALVNAVFEAPKCL